MAQPVFRFAPSPTGFLHLGHAHSALYTWRMASEHAGVALLRIEDIDTQRCRPEFAEAILEDLTWLGLSWPEPVERQTDHLQRYESALKRLEAFTYPCFCSRRDIAQAIEQTDEVKLGPEGPLYPGTCRRLGAKERAERIAAGQPYAVRLDVGKARAATGALYFEEINGTMHEVVADTLGDAILERRDTPASYHLSVVVDDAAQGVTHVTRGEDLRAATHLHRVIQALLGYDAPKYGFHGLLLDETGRKLSKRDGAEALRELRDRGVSASEVRAAAGYPDLGK